jgi:HTH-type transcriptional regulator, sugar sensing transcriptional regulator
MASNETLINILNNLEITGEQAQVYLALLELGEGNFTEISRKIGIKRTTLYNVVEKMERKGYVKKSIDNKKFESIQPQQLFEKLQSNNLVFFQAMPLFKSIMKKPVNLSKVKFYSGNKGIQQLFLDDLEAYRGKEEKILRTVSGASFYSTDADFRDQYAIKRQEMGIETRIISSYDLKPFVEKYRKQFSMQEVKFLPESLGPITGRISASLGRVALIGFTQDKSGIVITSKELADTFIKFFDFVWKMMK